MYAIVVDAPTGLAQDCARDPDHCASARRSGRDRARRATSSADSRSAIRIPISPGAAPSPHRSAARRSATGHPALRLSTNAPMPKGPDKMHFRDRRRVCRQLRRGLPALLSQSDRGAAVELPVARLLQLIRRAAPSRQRRRRRCRVVAQASQRDKAHRRSCTNQCAPHAARSVGGGAGDAASTSANDCRHPRRSPRTRLLAPRRCWPELPQHFAEVRRDVAVAIVRIGRLQIRQRFAGAPLAEQHPAQAVQNRGIFGRRRVGALDQLAGPREVLV